MTHLTQCPIEQLAAYLSDSLEQPLHDSLLAHLDGCEACRQRLEDVAGSGDDWKIAREALSDCDPNIAECLSQGVSLSCNSTNVKAADPLSLLTILAPSDDPRSAGRIGTFEVIGVVGSGGMGLVLKAHEPALDRFVAIKILSPHLAKSPSARKRFAREARAAAAVIHDNVIDIYQVSEWNVLPYLVMPYLPDRSLQQRIDEEGKLDIESVLSIGMQVARGLAAAHSQGLVHRDVKPANVMLAKGTERAIITDFGLARAADDASLTRVGLLAGTPHYMSPEQARGERVDQKSDLFSLGSLLFAMLAGQPPIQHETGSETIQQISKGDVPSVDSVVGELPAWLVRVVSWLHKTNPKDRPESAEQVAELLEQCLAHLRQPETQPLPDCLLREARSVTDDLWGRYVKKKWMHHAAMAISILLLAGLGVVAYINDSRVREFNSVHSAPRDPLIRTIQGHTGPIKCVALSAEGKLAVSGSGWPAGDCTLRLWNVETGRELRQFDMRDLPLNPTQMGIREAPGEVMCVAMTDDGRLVVAGLTGGAVGLWDVESGGLLRHFVGHSGSVYSVAISRDGDRVLSGGRDSTVRLWETKSGNELLRIDDAKSWIRCVAFSPDYSRVVFGGQDKTLRVVELSSGKTIDETACDDAIWDACFSPNGQQVAFVQARKVTVRDLNQKSNVVGWEQPQTVTCVAYSPDGESLLTGGYDAKLRLWSANTGELLETFKGHRGWIWRIAFAADGRTSISCSGEGSTEKYDTNHTDNTLRLWDMSQ